ncbi:MAG: zf-HC2 domain-containing protein [Candidatus Binatia bacterium]
MKNANRHPECPPFASLVEWFDGTLDEPEAAHVERHVDGCSQCRQVLLDWSERVRLSADATPECLDAETLVAYCAAPATLEPTAAESVERHLRQCARCVEAVQHVVALRRQMHADEPEAVQIAEAAALRDVTQRAVAPPATRLLAAVAEWWQRLGALLTPSLWPRAALATATAIVLTVGVVRWLSPMTQLQEMHMRSAEPSATVEVTADTVARARPDLNEPVVLQLTRGTHAHWLETSGEWSRIELTDGRRVWVQSRVLAGSHQQ